MTFSVWKSVQTLSISLLENSLLYVFYQEGRLLVQSGCRRVEVEGVMFQNQKQVSYYRLIDDWGLELTVSGD